MTNRQDYWNYFWEEDFSWGGPDAEVLEKIEKLIPPSGGVVVADMGCGDGRYSIPLAERGYTVDCYDYSDVALDRLERRAAEKSLRINRYKVDLTRVDRLERTYDLILCVGLIEEIPPPLQQRTVEIICKGLNPHGLALLRYLVKGRHSSPIEGLYDLDPGFLAAYMDRNGCAIISVDEGNKVLEDDHPLKVGGPSVKHNHEIGELLVERQKHR